MRNLIFFFCLFSSFVHGQYYLNSSGERIYVEIKSDHGINLGSLECDYSGYFLFKGKPGTNINSAEPYIKMKLSLEDGFKYIEEHEEDLAWAQPDMICPIEHFTDPLYPKQFQFNNTGQYIDGQKITAGLDVNVDGVWPTYKGNGITVAVIDDGLEAHDDLPTINANYTPINSDVTNTSKHGIAVAGIIAAQHNTIGVRGIAPDVDLIGENIFRQGVTVSGYADAITAVADSGAHVICNSWGFVYQDVLSTPDGYKIVRGGDCRDLFPVLTAAINYAATSGRGGNGCIVVFASGNWAQTGPLGQNSNECVTYPAHLDNVIAVGAVTPNGVRSRYTNHGPKLDISAPSNDLNSSGSRRYFGVRTTDRMGESGYSGSDYHSGFGGTSAAAPVVAGAAALILQADNTLTRQEVYDLITSTATDIMDTGFDIETGYGLLNVGAAIASIGAITPPAAPCAAFGGDNDGDGVCANIDCDDNDSSFPKSPGETCDDGSSSTINDKIQADGCTCAGETVACFPNVDNDGDGICSDTDCDDNNNMLPGVEGDPCDDGILETVQDTIGADGCSCAGRIPDNPCFDCFEDQSCDCVYNILDNTTCVDTGFLSVTSACVVSRTLTYEWSNGDTTQQISGMPGLYSVTITDDEGCIQVDTGRITKVDGADISLIHIDSTCVDASLSVRISGGQEPYDVEWAQNIAWDPNCDIIGEGCTYKVTSEGEYKIYVVDGNGCLDSTSTNVSFKNDTLMMNIIETDDDGCTDINEGKIEVNPYGEAPFEYNWSNGSREKDLTQVPPGAYNVTVIDSEGCEGEGMGNIVLINEDCAPECDLTVTYNSFDCTGAIEVDYEGNNGDVSFEWSDDSTTQNRTGLSVGTYTVTVSDTSSCSAIIEIEIAACCPTCIIGNPCDDGNPCTENTVYQSDCTCGGGNTIANDCPAASTVPCGDPIVSPTGCFTCVGTGTNCTDGTCVDEECCDSITNSGAIQGDESACGTSFDPMMITSSTAAYGGEGGTIIYQWQSSPDDAVWSDIGGATGLTYDPAAISSSTYYRRRAARDCDSVFVNSNSVFKELIANPNTAIGASPTSTCSSGTSTLTASGATSYVWSTGQTINPIVVSPGTYYVTGTTNGCSTVANITVGNTGPCCSSLTSGGSISGDQSVCGGYNPSTISNTVSPSGGSGGTIRYQWEISTNNSTWSTISGATSITYDPPSISSTRYYRRRSYRDCDNVNQYSNTVTKTVLAVPTVIISGGTSACDTENTTLTASGAPTASFSWSTGASGVNQISVPPGTYTVTGTSGGCSDTDSHTITSTGPCCSSLTSGGTIYNGNNQSGCVSYDVANLSNTVSPSGGWGGTIRYQWEVSSNNVTWSSVSGQIGLSYDPGVISSTTYYRRRAYRDCDNVNVYSNTVTATVSSPPSAGTNVDGNGNVVGHQDVDVCDGFAVIAATPSGMSSYSWSGGLGSGQIKPISVSTPTTYYITVTNSSGCTDVASVAVNPCGVINQGWTYVGVTWNISGGQDRIEFSNWEVDCEWATCSKDTEITRQYRVDGGSWVDHDVLGPLSSCNISGSSYLYFVTFSPGNTIDFRMKAEMVDEGCIDYSSITTLVHP